VSGCFNDEPDPDLVAEDDVVASVGPSHHSYD